MLVDLLNAIALASFWLLLFVGTGSTLSRVVYYRRYGFKRPRLLTRDALMIAGFATSFGVILLVRVLRAAGFDTSGLATNVLWSLLTSGPAIAAVFVYAWYEVFIIERGRDNERDETYFNPTRPPDEERDDTYLRPPRSDDE